MIYAIADMHGEYAPREARSTIQAYFTNPRNRRSLDLLDRDSSQALALGIVPECSAYHGSTALQFLDPACVVILWWVYRLQSRYFTNPA